MDSLRRVSTIALSTFRESIRSKILYSVIAFAALIVASSALFGSVTIGDQITVIQDFGLFSISLFCTLYCVVNGSTLLHKELTRRTIFNLLSKAVSRSEFLTGKFLGMWGTSLVLVGLMGGALLILLFLLDGTLHLHLVQAYIHIILELLIVCACVILFSCIVVTPLLIGMFSFGVFIAGRSLNVLLLMTEAQETSSLLRSFLTIFYWAFPQLNDISINDAIVYHSYISPSFTGWCTIYSVAYSILLLVVSTLIFRYREFNQ